MDATMLLIENLLTVEQQITFAKTILKAQEIQEESWNEKTCKYELSDYSCAIKACTLFQLPTFYTFGMTKEWRKES